MKTFIYYIFFFCIFFIRPCDAHSSHSKQGLGFTDSFKKIGEKYSFSSQDPKNSIYYSEDDFFNDDDENFSVKKKITLPYIVSFGNKQFVTKPFSIQIHKRPRSMYFPDFSLFEFISLNVLKL